MSTIYKHCATGLLEGKKPCSWNNCMTRARRWSRVRRRDEQGTRSKSPRRSSPSMPSWKEEYYFIRFQQQCLELFCSYSLSYLPCQRWRCLRRTWRHSSECWVLSCNWKDDVSSSLENWGLLQKFPALDTHHMKSMEQGGNVERTNRDWGSFTQELE